MYYVGLFTTVRTIFGHTAQIQVGESIPYSPTDALRFEHAQHAYSVTGLFLSYREKNSTDTILFLTNFWSDKDLREIDHSLTVQVDDPAKLACDRFHDAMVRSQSARSTVVSLCEGEQMQLELVNWE